MNEQTDRILFDHSILQYYKTVLSEQKIGVGFYEFFVSFSNLKFFHNELITDTKSVVPSTTLFYSALSLDMCAGALLC